MKMLFAELLENNISKKVESQSLEAGTSEEFFEALVLLCSGLNVEVPVWTHKEDKMLQKKKEVLFVMDPGENRALKIYSK